MVVVVTGITLFIVLIMILGSMSPIFLVVFVISVELVTSICKHHPRNTCNACTNN